MPGRLSRQHDFDRIYKQGKRYRGSLLTVIVLPGEETGPRAAYVVSKKVARQAVRRNRVRRWMREALRRLLALSTFRGDLILIAHQASVAADYHAIHGELMSLLGRARLLAPEASAGQEA